VALGAIVLLPPLRGHLAATKETTGLRALLSRSTVLWSLTMTATLMAAGFFVIPNLPAWTQQNLGFPRAQYQWLLAIGGVVSFVTLRLAGGLTDRFGSTKTGTVATVLTILVMYVYCVAPPAHPAPALVTLIYVAFLIALGARNVAYNALTTKVPRPAERARFLSIQSTVYHAASGTAAWLSSLLLTVRGDGSLDGMARLALIAMALSALLPLLLWRVETRVTQK
jgi:predicted MFS family arabinose efflux permease